MELAILQSIVGELWKPIQGFPNYLVSSYGRVLSLSREEQLCTGSTRNRQGRLLIPRLGNKGYLYVILRKDNRNYTRKIHRLVAEGFIPNPNGFECVNHKDECRDHNSVDNLEWCTNAYNLTYGNIRSKIKEAFIESGWSRGVEQYALNGNLIGRFPSVRSAANHIDRRPGGITNCCKGNRKSAYGFVWRYSN